MKKFLSLLMALTLISFSAVFICSCESNSSAENEQLTYYTIKDSPLSFDNLVRYYNDSAKKDYKIKIVEFENSAEMYSKMSTEIMSGAGPDLFSTEQHLPFEKMAEAKAFMDIDELLKSNKNTIDFSDLNRTVMDTGVFNGKRYIVPLFYGLGTVMAEKNTLEKFSMPTKMGYTPTYNNLDILNKVLADNDYSIFFGEGGYDSYNIRELFFRFIDSYMDIKTKTTEFTHKEFRLIAEKLKYIYINNKYIYINNKNKNTSTDYYFSPYIFNNWYSGLISYAFNTEGNVFYKDLSKKSTDNVGYIETGVAVNKNTKNTKSVIKFLEFALGNHIQVMVGSDRFLRSLEYVFLEDLTFPVKKSSFEVCIRYASQYEDLYSEISPGIDNEFMEEYIKAAKNVTKCRLYHNLQDSYYGSDIISEIVNDYLNDNISTDKFIRQLTNATWIYMEE